MKVGTIQDFSKSLKVFNPQPRNQNKTQENVGPVRSSMDEKIDLLRAPVYQRKKLLKKSPQFFNNPDQDKTPHSKFPEFEYTSENQEDMKGHYRYRSNIAKKTQNSWLRRTAGKFQKGKTKRNVIDIIVTEKQIEKDTMPVYQKTTSMMNLREKVSKSLLASQDSQSILRKNSLYLLNFIKRKQSRKQSQPHIGGIPNLASNMRISHSPIRGPLKYTPSKNQGRKRQQKITSAFSKFLNSMPIEPW